MKPFAHFTKTFLLFLICLSSSVFGQHTGSYDTSISFQAGSRAVSVYAPATYNPSNKYRLMVCLHGLGDVPSNYRDALINSLGWGSNFPNTIFVCPEAASSTNDFFDGDSTGSIVQSCIDFAKGKYSIDSQNIILQGFSLGGRAALRYGLRNYSKFKGLLLNTPAVQGVKNALNRQSYYKYDYQNASRIPIYVTHGIQDVFYQAPVDTAVEMLVLNDGKVRKYEFPTMGHSIPPFSGMSNCIAFFDSSTASKGSVASVERIYAPNRTCSPTFTPRILLRSMGSDTLKSATIQYIYNGVTKTYSWSGVLMPYKHTMVTLPSVSSAADIQSLVVNITSPATTEAAAGITDTAYIQYAAAKVKLPLYEGFENSFPENGWLSLSYGDYYSGFSIYNGIGKYSSNSLVDGNSIFIVDNSGMKDEFISPMIDLSDTTKAFLHFDVSYNYDQYTAAVLGKDTVLADTLQILVSSDCGNSWQSIYKKGGTQLATFASPILNATSLQADLFTPADSNWKHEAIDMSSYAGNTGVEVKFVYISDLGGFLFIDNIKVQSTNVGIEKMQAPEPITCYPNPVNDKIFFHSTNTSLEIKQMNISDITGRVVYTSSPNKNLSGDMSVDVSAFANGVYYLQIITENSIESKKFVISR